MKKRTAFIAALFSGVGLFYVVPAAISGPAMYFAFKTGQVVSQASCINAAYSVFAMNQLSPLYDVVREGDAQFAMAQNIDNSVIIDCSQSNRNGRVMVIASSYKRMNATYVNNMVNKVYDLLNN
tara:strand:- start:319 stop:690 length:372 start_codon:yes stop_codon:yes gene_type:complete